MSQSRRLRRRREELLIKNQKLKAIRMQTRLTLELAILEGIEPVASRDSFMRLCGDYAVDIACAWGTLPDEIVTYHQNRYSEFMDSYKEPKPEVQREYPEVSYNFEITEGESLLEKLRKFVPREEDD